jgi:imidazolonepropionase-like amidohydrolase
MQSPDRFFLSFFSRIKPARCIVATFAIVVLLSGCAREEEIIIEPGYYLFENVNVLPMDRERILENQRVTVRAGRIVSVSESGGDVPEGATVIDGTGHYLMPGLAEMHGHIPGPADPQYVDDVLFLYISNGVTLVRNMAGNPAHLALRDRVARGEIAGPVIFAATPWVTPDAMTAPSRT